jgi:hypothetical protein
MPFDHLSAPGCSGSRTALICAPRAGPGAACSLRVLPHRGVPRRLAAIVCGSGALVLASAGYLPFGPALGTSCRTARLFSMLSWKWRPWALRSSSRYASVCSWERGYWCWPCSHSFSHFARFPATLRLLPGWHSMPSSATPSGKAVTRPGPAGLRADRRTRGVVAAAGRQQQG